MKWVKHCLRTEESLRVLFFHESNQSSLKRPETRVKEHFKLYFVVKFPLIVTRYRAVPYLWYRGICVESQLTTEVSI